MDQLRRCPFFLTFETSAELIGENFKHQLLGKKSDFPSDFFVKTKLLVRSPRAEN